LDNKIDILEYDDDDDDKILVSYEVFFVFFCQCYGIHVKRGGLTTTLKKERTFFLSWFIGTPYNGTSTAFEM
jgi:hypothetical protein